MQCVSTAERWWPSALRLVAGGYWLYFGSQKWGGVNWMRPLIQSNPGAEPIPGLKQILQGVVAPNWQFFAVSQGVLETTVGLLLVLGLATRIAAAAGFLLAAELSLTVAFLAQDDGFRWLYYLAVLVNAQVLISGGGPFSLDRLLSSRSGWR